MAWDTTILYTVVMMLILMMMSFNIMDVIYEYIYIPTNLYTINAFPMANNVHCNRILYIGSQCWLNCYTYIIYERFETTNWEKHVRESNPASSQLFHFPVLYRCRIMRANGSESWVAMHENVLIRLQLYNMDVISRKCTSIHTLYYII